MLCSIPTGASLRWNCTTGPNCPGRRYARPTASHLEDAPTPEEREIIRQNLGRTSTELIDASNTERAAPAAAVTAAATAPVTLSGLADVDARALDLLTEAVEAAVQKAMERAGARIRNQTRKEKLLADSIAAADNRQVALTFGRRVALQLVPESDLVTESGLRPAPGTGHPHPHSRAESHRRTARNVGR